MKTRDNIGIGDPVEVRFMLPPMRRFVGGHDMSHGDPEYVWQPGTVCTLDRDKIGVAFAGGIRQELPRRSNAWRIA